MNSRLTWFQQLGRAFTCKSRGPGSGQGAGGRELGRPCGRF